MLQVRLNHSLKGFTCAFLEVAAATAVAMQVNTTGHHIHVVGIDGLVHTVELSAAPCHLPDAGILNDDRASFYPTLGGEYLTVVNLS